MRPPEKLGRYQVMGEVGRGAMGVVYRGWDPQLERPVAIKAILTEAVTGGTKEEIVARFLREAKLAARIAHPGVVTVFDAGEEQDQLFLVMELVEGESLAARLRRGDFPTTEQALELAAQVAEALGAAHQSGIVHRDVKPANVLITRDGRVKVSDFGVAKAVGEATGLTLTGTAVGSPAYMSPEQVRGEQVDARSDLFSLGVMLYEMLLRRRPFPAETLTTLVYQILHEDPFADPQGFGQLSPDLVKLLKWCLAKDRSQRIPDAATFVSRARVLAQAGLDRTVSTMPTVAIPPSAPTSAQESAAGAKGRWRAWAWGVGVLALALAAGLLWRRRTGPTPAEVLLAGAVPTPTPAAELTLPPEAPTPVPTWTPSPTPTVLAKPAPTPTPEPLVVPIAAPSPSPTPTPTPPIVMTYFGRHGAVFNVSPEEALVEVEGKVIGIADDWDGKGGGKVYEFSRPGTYYAKLSLRGYKTAWVAIVITPSAKEENADVDWELEELD